MVSRLVMGIIGVIIWFLRIINIRIPHDLPSNVCCSGSKVFRGRAKSLTTVGLEQLPHGDPKFSLHLETPPTRRTSLFPPTYAEIEMRMAAVNKN